MAQSNPPHTILLKGDGVFKEGNAGGAITPGHLVTINTTAEAVVVHATAAAAASKLFAVENDIIGKGIDTAYASGDRVYYVACQPGCEINALVAAAAAAIVRGDLLESAGNGTLRKLAAGVALARALEAVDNSAGGTPHRLRVEVL
jgi:hypothetical protein